MLNRLVGATEVLQSREPNLGKDRTELARGGGDAVTGGAVAGWEHFAGNDKSRGVWS